jgi:hypothetical protein
LLTSPDYDDARLSVLLERAKNRSRALRRQRQRRWQAVIAGGSAAILVAGGAWYGITARPGGAGHPGGTASDLTAVRGCPGLAAASGMLKRVNGSRLILKDPGDEPVTVITTASSALSRQVTGTVRDITTGTHVIVAGTGSGGGIAARSVVLGALPRLHGPSPAHRRRGHPSRRGPRRSPARGGRADGTVTAVSTGSFTLLTPGGFHIRVTTSGSTTVYTQTTSTLSQFQVGEFTIAVGRATSDATLAAATAEQGTLMPRFEHGGGILRQPWLGCSPSAITTAAFLTEG